MVPLVKLESIAAAALAGSVLASPPALAQVATNDVGELIVTAQRRSEPLTAVPITMSAFTGAQLDQLSVKRLPEIATIVPGVQLQAKKGAGLPNFVIRGAGLLDYNPNNSPPTAVYIDEVYQPSPAMGEIPLIDLDRIEILKGPQGGLYGRDTSGGAIQVVSRRAQLGEHEGYVTLGYGRWNRFTWEGAGNIPLGDKAALRLTVYREDGDDTWQRSLFDNRNWGEPDRTYGRLQLRVQPTERLDVNLKLEAGWDGSETVLGRSIALYTPAGAWCAAALQGRRDDAGCFNLSQVIRGMLRQPISPSGAAQTGDGSLTLSRPFNELANRNLSGTLNATYSFDGAELTSVTSLGKFRFGQNTDFAASVDRLALQTERTDIETFSQELRLVSTGDGPLRWMVGAIWAEDDLVEWRSIDMRDNILIQRSLGIPDPARAILQLSYNQDSRYAAAYGQLAWRFTDALSLTGDLRYSDQKKRYYNGFVGAARPYITLLSGLESDYELEDHWSGKATLDWKPRSGAMVYASVARGYKSGGIFGGFNQVAGQVAPYTEETVWAYEAGFKTEWLDRRLQVNGAAFHYDYLDAQGFTNVPMPIAGGLTAAYPLLTNLGDADHNGVELEAVARPAKGLTLQAGAAWLEAAYTDTDVVNTSPEALRVPLEGRSRPFAPKWSGFALARYETTLTASLGAALQVDANFRSRLTFPVTPVERALGGVPGYTLVNARVTFDIRPHAFQVAAFVTNLADRRYRLDFGSDGLGSYTEIYGEPRTWGVEVTKRW
jgi:iron complex outermembrane receptor protein